MNALSCDLTCSHFRLGHGLTRGCTNDYWVCCQVVLERRCAISAKESQVAHTVPPRRRSMFFFCGVRAPAAQLRKLDHLAGFASITWLWAGEEGRQGRERGHGRRRGGEEGRGEGKRAGGQRERAGKEGWEEEEGRGGAQGRRAGREGIGGGGEGRRAGEERRGGAQGRRVGKEGRGGGQGRRAGEKGKGGGQGEGMEEAAGFSSPQPQHPQSSPS